MGKRWLFGEVKSRNSKIATVAPFVLPMVFRAVLNETRLDTQLLYLRVGGQELCWRRSLEHLGRSRTLKKLKNAKKVKKGPTNQPTH